MSDTDSFIDEVTEEVRRDQLYTLLRKWGWIAVLVVLLIVGGAAWNEWRKARVEAASQSFGDALYDALDTPEEADRLAALAAIEVEDGTAAAAITGFLTASEQEEVGDAAAAMATLDAIAVNGAVPSEYRALAALKSAMVSAGVTPEADRRIQLEALAQPGQPFRMLALEQIALSYVAEGDTEAALSQLSAILEDAETGQTLRDRTQSLIVALGGELSDEGVGN